MAIDDDKKMREREREDMLVKMMSVTFASLTFMLREFEEHEKKHIRERERTKTSNMQFCR